MQNVSSAMCARFFVAVSIVLFVTLSADAQERFYLYRDGDVTEVGKWANVFPELSAVFDLVTFRRREVRGFDSQGFAGRVTFSFLDARRINFTNLVGAPLQPLPSAHGFIIGSQRDYWGQWPGPGFDLSRARKLVFWARGDRGGEVIQVKVAIAGDQEYGDSARAPVVNQFYTLDSQWTVYSVDVNGAELQRVITPFVLICDKNRNLDRESVTVYLDEIYYELGS